MHPRTPWAKALESLCLIKLKRLGGRATAREIADDIGKPLKLICPRMSALKVAGKIRDTGLRVKGDAGRPQVIWADNETTTKENDQLFADEGVLFRIPSTDDSKPAPSIPALRSAASETARPAATEAPKWFDHYGH